MTCFIEQSELRSLTFVPCLPDPAHDAIDQAYPCGNRAVSRGPRGGERKVQLVAAGAARTLSVELLRLVLSSRRREREDHRDVPGVCEPILVARETSAVLRLRSRC